jgi:hypothetical protein
MSSHPAVEPTIHEPALVAARVVESALELARAEAKLVSAHARTALARTVAALLAGMLATSAAQVALLLLALSPVFLASRPLSPWLFALGISVGLSAVGAWLAVSAWRGLQGSPVTAPIGK